MEEEEEVSHGSEKRDEDAEAKVDPDTGGALNDGDKEVERVDEEGDEARDEEDAVPSGHEVAARV